MLTRTTISLTTDQLARLDAMSELTGVTRNGLICLAVHEWLESHEKSPRWKSESEQALQGLRDLRTAIDAD